MAFSTRSHCSSFKRPSNVGGRPLTFVREPMHSLKRGWISSTARTLSLSESMSVMQCWTYDAHSDKYASIRISYCLSHVDSIGTCAGCIVHHRRGNAKTYKTFNCTRTIQSIVRQKRFDRDEMSSVTQRCFSRLVLGNQFRTGFSVLIQWHFDCCEQACTSSGEMASRTYAVSRCSVV